MAVNRLKRYELMIQRAIDELQNEDELFVEMVDEMDSWNGYADRFKCYPMEELDELNCGMKLSEFLNQVSKDFKLSDDWFYYSDRGIESTDDRVRLYRDNVNESDLLDNILANANHISFFNHSEFEEYIYDIIDLKDKINEEE